MMIDTIKKFVKYGVFESTTDNYDYAIVDNTDDFFDKYYLTDNTIIYNGMKLNCYSGSRFFFDNGEAICKSDITCYGVSAEYYVEAMEKLEKQRKIKLEKAEKLSIAKTVLKSFDGMVYNKKIRKSLAEHGIYLEVRTYSLEMYYASNHGSTSEYLSLVVSIQVFLKFLKAVKRKDSTTLRNCRMLYSTNTIMLIQKPMKLLKS